MSEITQRRSCRSCLHFHNDPQYLEAAFPGWTALGSAYGSTRADDGICELRGVYLSAEQCCEDHERRGATSADERER